MYDEDTSVKRHSMGDLIHGGQLNITHYYIHTTSVSQYKTRRHTHQLIEPHDSWMCIGANREHCGFDTA